LRINDVAEAAIAFEFGLDQHVAEDGIVDPRFDALEPIAFVVVAVDAVDNVAARHAHRYLDAAIGGFDRRFVEIGETKETVRREPDRQLIRPRGRAVDSGLLSGRRAAWLRTAAADAARIHVRSAHRGLER